MSNYNPITNFTAKDTLANGDPNKVIKGATIDPELSAIATAIATKQDTPLQNLAVSSTAGTMGLTVTANTTTSNSLGIRVVAGTNSTDTALEAVTAGSGVSALRVRGDSHITTWRGDFTPYAGSTVVTATGPFTAGQALTVYYIQYGNQMTLHIPRCIGTGGPAGVQQILIPFGTSLVPYNATSTTDVTGMPCVPINYMSGGAIQANCAFAYFRSDAVIQINASATWATSGNNGFPPFSFTYRIATPLP